MIWLLAHPLPPSPVSKLQRRHTGYRRKDNFLTESRDRGERGWASSRIIRPQESLVLYKSFHTVWYLLRLCSFRVVMRNILPKVPILFFTKQFLRDLRRLCLLLYCCFLKVSNLSSLPQLGQPEIIGNDSHSGDEVRSQAHNTPTLK